MKFKGAVSDTIERITLGVKYGVVIAAFYCIYAIGLFILRGSEPFTHDETTIWGALIAYLVGGIMAGGIVGAFQPMVRSRIGAAIVYGIGAFFVMLSIGVTVDGWRHVDLTGCLVMAATLGIMGSFLWRNLFA
jgi:hypothetical protein